MHHTEQTLQTAIGELNCISPDRPASLDELRALSIALDCVDQLLRSCVQELRAHAPADARKPWADIADALGSESVDATKKRFTRPATGNAHVAAFWESYCSEFAWDFLPHGFLHALYVHWLSASTPDAARMTPGTFARRLKPLVMTTGDWMHTRARLGSLTSADEPLLDRIPDWSLPEGNPAVWGFRRTAPV